MDYSPGSTLERPWSAGRPPYPKDGIRQATLAEPIKATAVVKRYVLRPMRELYAHLNPMSSEAATQMEKDLAEDLRRAGYAGTAAH